MKKLFYDSLRKILKILEFVAWKMLLLLNLLFSAVFFLIIISVRYKARRKILEKAGKEPPGPFAFPIIGNLIQLAASGLEKKSGSGRQYYYEAIFRKLTKKYGTLIGLKFGGEKFVLLTRYEDMKEILCTPFATPRYLPDFLRCRGQEAWGNSGIIWNNDIPNWHMSRRFLSKGLKRFTSNTNGNAFIREEIQEYLNHILGNSSAEGIWEYDHAVTKASIFNVAWSFAAGKRYDLGDEKGRKVLEYCDVLHDVGAHNNLYLLLPWLVRILPERWSWKRYMPVFRDFNAFLKETVDTVEMQMTKESSPENLIEFFLKNDVLMDDNSSEITKEQLHILLQDLCFAFVETTSRTLRWALIYLAERKLVQEKVLEEVSSVISPDESDILDLLEDDSRFLYTKAFLLEVMRHPPVPVAISAPPRRLTKSLVTTNGYFLEKGTTVAWNIGLALKDSTFWKDPETFRPERFIANDEETGKFRIYKELSERVILFGFGRRICPGEKTAWTILMAYIILILKKFKLSTISDKLCEPAKFSLKVKRRI